MLKKNTAVIVACVVLFVLLVALLLFEMQNPEGGVKLLGELFGGGSADLERVTEARSGVQLFARAFM